MIVRDARILGQPLMKGAVCWQEKLARHAAAPQKSDPFKEPLLTLELLGEQDPRVLTTRTCRKGCRLLCWMLALEQALLQELVRPLR